jgi:Protein of unknown function (DUF3617)
VTTIRCAVLLFVVATCASFMGRADELPHRRPGLWEITRLNVDANKPARTSRICIDGATETLLRDMGTSFARGNCSKAAVSVSGHAINVDSVCQLERSRLTNHTVITFTSDTTYHHVAAAHFDPPLFGRADSTSEMDGRWLGPCTAEMRPGDVTTPLGTVNLVDRARSPK